MSSYNMTELTIPMMTSAVSTIASLSMVNQNSSGVLSIVDETLSMNEVDQSLSVPVWVGFIGCLVATIFFGSNLVPIKQFSSGDGFFFHLIFCVAMHTVGIIVDLILNNQRFYPLAMLGGFLWSIGSITTVFSIKTCGLAVGMLIWNTTSLIVGWAGGRFGLFGINPQVPTTTSKLIMNYISVILAAFSAVLFILIKSPDKPIVTSPIDQENGQLPAEMIKAADTGKRDKNIAETDFPFLNRISKSVQRVMGCVISALAGVFYGVMFVPDQYIRDHPEKYVHCKSFPPNNGLYYVRSQYSGILLSAIGFYIIYTLLKRNKPMVNPSIILPGLISGSMSGIANVGFILAISSLKSAVAYPIVSVLPGVVTSLWSLFWFREIKGTKNYIYLVIGMVIRCVSAVLSGLSV